MIRELTLTRGKDIADLLTWSRVFLAIVIFFAALTGQKSLLSFVIAMIVIGWTTDVLDGKLARSDASDKKTWIGNHDFVADMSMSYAGMFYFMTSGYLPFWPFFLYGIYSLTVALIWLNKSYVMAVAAPVSAMPVIFALIYSRFMALVFIAWIIASLISQWGRFKEEIKEFVEGV